MSLDTNSLLEQLKTAVAEKLQEVVPQAAQVAQETITPENILTTAVIPVMQKVKESVDTLQTPPWVFEVLSYKGIIIMSIIIWSIINLFLTWTKGEDDQMTKQVRSTGNTLLIGTLGILTVMVLMGLVSGVDSSITFIKSINF
jgi:methanogenic corrinoid protein MtbC1